MILAMPTLVVLLSGFLQSKPATKRPVKTAAKPAVPVRPAVAEKAEQARLAGQFEEAIKLYQQGLRTNPKWSEGWYFLGTIYYERDQAKECVDAMGRFAKLEPKVSSGFAVLGLCLFQATDYANSLAALTHAERLGLPRGEKLTDVASYHAALLYTKESNFERALQILNTFSNREPQDPKIVEAMGIAALRKPIFPTELAPEDREVVYRTGRAVLTAGNRRTPEAAKLLTEIIQDFPKMPNLHFVYGNLLVSADPDRGVAVLEEELAIQPNHLPTLVLLGLEYLRRNEWAKATEYGERATANSPLNFTGHVILGRALVESGADVKRGIKELERAKDLEPTSPQVRIALASAYAKDNRREDAATQRAEFLRLKKLIEEQRK